MSRIAHTASRTRLASDDGVLCVPGSILYYIKYRICCATFLWFPLQPYRVVEPRRAVAKPGPLPQPELRLQRQAIRQRQVTRQREGIR